MNCLIKDWGNISSKAIVIADRDEIASKRTKIKNPTNVVKAESSSSISMAMAMSAWQQTTDTVGERDQYLLDNNMFTDVKFIVGEEEEGIPSHRLLLARTSPTFAAMFYGGLAKNNEPEIKIPDVSPDAFKALLKYVYCGKLKLKNYDLAWEILYAAKKYLMPDTLITQIQEYIRKQLYLNEYGFGTKDDVKNIWPSIQFANAYSEEELLEITWQYVEQNTSQVLNHENFVDISPTILETLVKKENLKCTEDELFEACMKWVKKEAQRKNIDPESQNLRDLLKSILPHIRFMAFDAKAFADGPAKLGLLTESEIESIMSRNISNQATSICNVIIPRKFQSPDHFYVIGEPVAPVSHRKHFKGLLPKLTYDKYTSSGAFESPSNNVIGFKIPSQIKKCNVSNDVSYVESFTAYFYEDYDEYIPKWNKYAQPCYECYVKELEETKIAWSKHFKSVVKYNSEIFVQFDSPSALLKNGGVEYWCRFGIVFHKSGCYPKTLAKKCNKTKVKLDSGNDVKIVEEPHGFMTLLCHAKEKK